MSRATARFESAPSISQLGPVTVRLIRSGCDTAAFLAALNCDWVTPESPIIGAEMIEALWRGLISDVAVPL